MALKYQGSLFEGDNGRARREHDTQIEQDRLAKTYGTPEFLNAYKAYISSARWRIFCKGIISIRNSRCEKCGAVGVRLEVHHKTYEHFHDERPEDVEVLCRKCHQSADKKRVTDNHYKFLEAFELGRYNSAQDTYLSKRYGENWNDRNDSEVLCEKFHDWYEQRRDRDD